jgi:GH24 family phage-related lysozyme (muramidase)
MNIEQLIERIKREEGFSPYSFWDDAKGGGKGQWSWGFGTCAPGEGCYIHKAKALAELEAKVAIHLEDYNEIFHGCAIPSEKEDALMDMLYNLGESRFRKFRKLIAAVKVADWLEAGKQVRNSIYYKQVTNRAERNAQTLEAA